MSLDQTTIFNTLVLLLPGFVVLKTRQLFFPKIPSQKQSTFDQIATYLVSSFLVYIVTLPATNVLQVTDIYKTALTALIVAFVLGLSSSLFQLFFQSSQAEWIILIRDYLRGLVPNGGSLWHRVFQLDKKLGEVKSGTHLVNQVIVYMKGRKTAYIGELYAYPIEDNTQHSKDFVLRGVTQMGHQKVIAKFPPDYLFLINQRDVESIVVHHEAKKRRGRPPKVKNL